jgi:hypothetical protein
MAQIPGIAARTSAPGARHEAGREKLATHRILANYARQPRCCD